MDVTTNDQLLVRVKVGTKYQIQIWNRLIGNLITGIPSICNHEEIILNKHPRHPDYVLESCSMCKEIRGFNIKTGKFILVHKGSEIFSMFGGPEGSLFTVDPDYRLSKLDFNEDPSEEAKLIYRRNVPLRMFQKQYLRFCYLECHDILVFTVNDPVTDEDYEILAAKLKNDKKVWKLFGPVGGHMIKPESMTCDNEGNVYVTDRSCNRILKINGLTGEVLRILLLDEEEEDEKIISIHWSSTEPNLTVLTENQISTYFVSKIAATFNTCD